jgi:hypothetical protein
MSRQFRQPALIQRLQSITARKIRLSPVAANDLAPHKSAVATNKEKPFRAIYMMICGCKSRQNFKS